MQPSIPQLAGCSAALLVGCSPGPLKLDAWDERGRASAIALTAGRAQGLGEHGFQEHTLDPYQEPLAAPLVLRAPGLSAGARVDVVSRAVDLSTTLLERLALEPSREPSLGRATRLAALARGSAADGGGTRDGQLLERLEALGGCGAGPL